MKAKVIYQSDHQTCAKPFCETDGLCGNCWGLVSRNQYGFDEVCPECGAELDWSGDNEADI